MPMTATFCATCELFQHRFLRSKSRTTYLSVLNPLLATFVLLLTFAIKELPEYTAHAKLRAVGAPRCYRDGAMVQIHNSGRIPADILGGSVAAKNLSSDPGAGFELRIEGAGAAISPGTEDVRVTYWDGKENVKGEFLEPVSDVSQKLCNYVFNINYQDKNNDAMRSVESLKGCTCPSDRMEVESKDSAKKGFNAGVNSDG